MKSFVRVFFEGDDWHRWVDIPMQEGVNFGQFMAQARFEGFIQSELVYVPLNRIKVAMHVKLVEAETQLDFTKARAMQ